MGEDATVDADRTPTRRRVKAPEAAEILGITEEAVRGRIKRGTLRSERTEEGVFVLLDADQATDRSQPDDIQARPDAREELVEDLRDRVAFLERELERRGDETERLHRIVAGLTQANAHLAARVPELEAPRSTPERPEAGQEAPQEPASGPGGVRPPASPQTATSRPWWRRIIGG